MPKIKPKGGQTRPKDKPTPKAARPRMSAFRLAPETLALIDRLAESFRVAPEMTVTKTSVVELAVRELAERRLKGTTKWSTSCKRSTAGR